MPLSRPGDCKQPHTAVPLIERVAAVSRTLGIDRKHALLEAGVGARNRRSASSIKTRIFRDFSGSGKVDLVTMEFSHFRKPLHFNGKYAYIE
ncbi:hypothetical protein [Mesorhizobium sp. LCM 4577]|uniref:hypothetical protein n=1 Tax=Mesorhizobium sp. LCM 4577 TaxID=1848288 RepID=UPI0010422B40|nr:hypothetical protein [Mesorhizobium sp. LCM 4577]